MNNTRYLELDFYRTGYKAVKAHQYDKDTRFIEITCVNDAAPFPLDPAQMTCNLKLITPDGRHMFKQETICPDGKVLISLEESMLLAAGICKAELNVYELDSRRLLSTMPFDLVVVGSVYDNTVIEDSDERLSAKSQHRKPAAQPGNPRPDSRQQSPYKSLHNNTKRKEQ